MLNGETCSASPWKSDARQGPVCHLHSMLLLEALGSAGVQQKEIGHIKGAGRGQPGIMCS